MKYLKLFEQVDWDDPWGEDVEYKNIEDEKLKRGDIVKIIYPNNKFFERVGIISNFFYGGVNYAVVEIPSYGKINIQKNYIRKATEEEIKNARLFEQYDWDDPFGEDAEPKREKITMETNIEVGDEMYFNNKFYGKVDNIRKLFTPYMEGTDESEEIIIRDESGMRIILGKRRLMTLSFEIKKK